MKKNQIFLLLIAVGLFWQCQQEKDVQFSIRKDGVGFLNRDTPFTDITTLYAADSVISDSSFSLARINRINIFEKGGKPLLTVTPDNDSIQGIGNIRINDPRYLTDKGIGLASTFKDIKAQYDIKKVVTSINNVVIFVKDHDVYFTIDREELPASLRYTQGINIEEVQIPDKAKIKYLMIGWD
ncbi:MAG: hypothetical protein KJO20_05790 [Eudoraea sp.]|nr:hypothetical protein [Eudoraea sp.]